MCAMYDLVNLIFTQQVFALFEEFVNVLVWMDLQMSLFFLGQQSHRRVQVSCPDNNLRSDYI